MRVHAALGLLGIMQLIAWQESLAQPSSAAAAAGSFPQGVWAAFYEMALIDDLENRLSRAQEITHLPAPESALFAGFAVDAWAQLEDLIRSEVREACEDQAVALSPSALLERILDDRHRIERFQQVAVAELMEQLGEEAASVILDSIEPVRSQLPEVDYFWVAQQEGSSEYFHRICTQVDPRNLR